jgi:putative intracellular protease/amidase
MKLKKKTCYVFVFDGFSDWELAYASVGINKSKNYQLRTIGISRDPVTSMGGITVVPDLDFLPWTDLADIDRSTTAMLILPGGAAWEERTNEAITPLLAHCLLQGIPVAAICGATLFLADQGILNRTPHTSNDVLYLEAMCPMYKGRSHYQAEPVVATDSIITAGGSAPVEFAREIFARLDILGDEAVATWFGYMDKQSIVL